VASHKGEAIRNVALVGHSGSGKTMLAEAMLFKGGELSRLGKVSDGTTASDFDLDEPLTFDVVAETVGARRTLIVRLVQQGLIETLDGPTDEPLVPRRAVIQLRRMQRLRRDLGVNFAGAAIILDLVGRIEQLNRELAEMHRLK